MVKLKPLLTLEPSGDRGVLLASFPYNPHAIAAIKQWPGSRWQGKTKQWRVPAEFADRMADIAQKNNWALRGVSPLSYHHTPLAQSDNLLGVFDYQHLFAQRAVYARSRMCASEMGCGKTPAALEALAESGAENILIVCPGGVRSHWAKQIKKWWPDCPHGTAKVTAGKQWADDSRFEKLLGIARRGITITSYDLASGALGQPHRNHYDAIVMDESHHVKNRKAGRSQDVRSLCLFNDKALRIMLSATPFDRPADLWHQLDILFPGRYGSHFKFAQAYANCEHNGYGWDISGLHTDPDAIAELKMRLGLVCDRVTKKDITHLLPPLTVSTETVAASKRDWRAMREGLSASGGIRAHEDQIEASLARAGSIKTKAVRSKIEELRGQGLSIIATVYHRAAARDICYGHEDWLYIDGQTSFDQRDEIIALAEKTGRPLVATMGAIAEGIDLTYADVAIIGEFTYKSRLMIQTLGRFHRLSSTKPVTLLFFYIEGTWDEVVAMATEEKITDIGKVLGAGESEEILSKAATGSSTESEFADRLASAAANMFEEDVYL